ncbi:MAG: hypothetical protein M1497_05185 [Nitrospirae bacterium]|nr:hypothetical protein [Nitrospirota bacterium]
MKWLGITSIFLAILAVPLGFISGLGVSMALFALLLSGISSLSGRFKYVSIVIIVTTLNLFFVSVESASWSQKRYAAPYPHEKPPIEWPEVAGARASRQEALNEFIKFVSIPYGITLLCVLIGIRNRYKKKIGKNTLR